MPDRLLKPVDIPASLWDGQSLRFAAALANPYRQTLVQFGLLERAETEKPGGRIGGCTKDAADGHFAVNFSGSCARVQLAMLDPKDHLEEASNALIRAFAGGSVGLLDIPCGSGAATANVLSAITELRRQNVVPRIPLEVWMVGGDHSAYALAHAEKVLEAMRPELEAQAIHLHYKCVPWDLTDATSTTALIFEWMTFPQNCSENVVLITNCSGFLADKVTKTKERLGEIFRWADQRRSVVVWVEPNTNKACNLFAAIWQAFVGLFGESVSEPERSALSSEADFLHPLVSQTCKVRLSLLHLKRNVK